MIHARRRFLAASLAAGLLAACRRMGPPLRVSSFLWAGYGPLFLARELGYLDAARVRLIEQPNNTANLMALAAGEVEAATLTLDECLLSLSGGLALKVLWVFDDSRGGDVLIARPGIDRAAQLIGRTVGLEQSAVGALVFAQSLQHLGLGPDQVTRSFVPVDHHVSAWQSGQLDAIVTYEPHASRILALGGRRLVDSSAFPGLILDVLAARAEALDSHDEGFAHLLAGLVRAHELFQQQPGTAMRHLAPHMDLSPQALAQAYAGIHLMSLEENRDWLTGQPNGLERAAATVAKVLRDFGLLAAMPEVSRLADARFLPRGGP